MPKPGSEGHGKSGHLSDRLRQKAAGGTLPLVYSSIAIECTTIVVVVVQVVLKFSSFKFFCREQFELSREIATGIDLIRMQNEHTN